MFHAPFVDVIQWPLGSTKWYYQWHSWFFLLCGLSRISANTKNCSLSQTKTPFPHENRQQMQEFIYQIISLMTRVRLSCEFQRLSLFLFQHKVSDAPPKELNILIMRSLQGAEALIPLQQPPQRRQVLHEGPLLQLVSSKCHQKECFEASGCKIQSQKRHKWAFLKQMRSLSNSFSCFVHTGTILITDMHIFWL